MIQLENNFVNIALNYFYYYIAFWNVSHRFSHTMSYRRIYQYRERTRIMQRVITFHIVVIIEHIVAGIGVVGLPRERGRAVLMQMRLVFFRISRYAVSASFICTIITESTSVSRSTGTSFLALTAYHERARRELTFSPCSFAMLWSGTA